MTWQLTWQLLTDVWQKLTTTWQDLTTIRQLLTTNGQLLAELFMSTTSFIVFIDKKNTIFYISSIS
jgi:hypothetical protein